MRYQYDLVVIGGGSGGLVATSSTAQMGLKVLLIEKEKLGGDCLWYGCVPSKGLIASAKRAQNVRDAHLLGLPETKLKQPVLKHVLDRVREVQAKIEPHDSPERFKGLGADVEFGEAHFMGPHTLMLNNKKISFKYAIVSTGSSPFVPDLEGLHETGFITNVNVFSQEELPKRLIVLGGGPIGVELGQAFARLGSKVTIVARSGILKKEDPELLKVLKEKLESEGIEIISGFALEKFEMKSSKVVHLKNKKDGKKILECDEILLAVGRRPNIEGLQLDQAGVNFNENGIEVDDYLRTSKKNIFAIGDVIGKLQFTHMAASHASTAVRNMISPIKSRAETIVPWVTYTDPEFARVGLIESEAKEKGIDHEVLNFEMSSVDRALTEGTTEGKIKVVIKPNGEILGASILGHNAGEMIMEYVIAMKHNLKVQGLAATIHPYPTFSGATWTLAGSYYKKLLTPRNKKISQLLFRL